MVIGRANKQIAIDLIISISTIGGSTSNERKQKKTDHFRHENYNSLEILFDCFAICLTKA